MCTFVFELASRSGFRRCCAYVQVLFPLEFTSFVFKLPVHFLLLFYKLQGIKSRSNCSRGIQDPSSLLFSWLRAFTLIRPSVVSFGMHTTIGRHQAGEDCFGAYGNEWIYIFIVAVFSTFATLLHDTDRVWGVFGRKCFRFPVRYLLYMLVNLFLACFGETA